MGSFIRSSAVLCGFFVASLSLQATETSGIISGEFRVSEQGAASYSIPLNLPAGTAGVTPQISLNYSSQGGDGVMGMGWSLSAGSAITRCPKTIAQDGVISGIDFSSNDQFCLNGQRLKLTAGTHARSGAIYYTELDSFAKVTAYGNATDTGPLGFTVETKSGEVHYYGYVDTVTGENAISLRDYWNNSEVGSDAFIEPNGRASKEVAQSYLLKAIKDVSGNYIVYEYTESNGSANLDRVSYTGNANMAQKPYAYVQMNYATKYVAAKRSGYLAGSAVLQDKLLTSIDVKLDGQSVHYYDLSYFTPTLAEETYTLESIQECTDTTKSSCYPVTTFDWYKPVPSNQTTQQFCEYEPNAPEICFDQTVSADFNPFGNQSGKLTSGYNVGTNQVFDMNGDGYSDIIYTQNNAYRVAFGPTFATNRYLTSIGDENSQYLLSLDYNGDGKRDLLVASSATAQWTIVSFEDYTTTVLICDPAPGGGGPLFFGGQICYPQTTTSDLKVASIGRTATGLEGKAQILDIDGNGLEDIVFQTNSGLSWYKNNGGSFAAASVLTSFSSGNTGAFLNSSIEKHTANMKNASGIDINGDGRSDLIVKVTDTVSSCMVNGKNYGFVSGRLECEVDIGGTWSSTSTTGYKLYISDGVSLNSVQNLGNYEDVRVADLNGDGLTDLLTYSASSTWSYRLSNGRAFLSSHSLPNGSTTDAYKNQSYFIDLNGDGAVDFLKATSNTNWQIFISQYASDETISLLSRGNISRTSGAVYQFGDVNGDGKLDLLQGKTDSYGWKVSYAPRAGKPDYVMKSITNGFGVSTEIFYRPMTDTNVYLFSGADADVDDTTFSPMSGMSLVSRVESDASTGTSGNIRVAIDYQYGGFLVHRQGRGMLGFEQVRTIDNTTGIETETVYDQTFPYIGMPLATRQLLSDGTTIISDASNTLAQKSTINGQIFPYIASSSEKSWSVGSDNLVYEINHTTSSFSYDSYGNLTNSTVTVSDHTGVNNDVTTATVNSFSGSDWEKRKGRLKSTTVTKTRDYISQSRTTDFTYYSQYDPSHAGMLHTSVVQSTNPLTTTYDYDGFGNKSKVTKGGAENSDGSNYQYRIAQSVYGMNGRLLDSTIDSAGITASYTYNGYSADSVTGRITQITTRVNNISQTNYLDDWGRTIQSTSPGGSSTYTDYQLCSAIYCDGSGGHFRIRTTQSGAPEKRVYYDIFGREIESRVKSFSGSWNIIRREYDSQGRESKTYEPTTGTSIYYTQPTYDLYGRVTQIRRPNSTYTYTGYYGLKTQHTDGNGNVSYSWQNEQGELDKTQDAKGNTLDYTYDAYGNLLNVLMTNSTRLNSTTKIINTFDDFGHKTQTDDTDKGLWTYQYNAFDELVQQTTAKNQSSYLDYDDAGRLVRRYEVDGTSCWNYDASTGRLNNEKVFNNVNYSLSQCASNNNENHRKTYFYDNVGRVDQTDVRIQSVNANVNGTYSTSSSFDSFGRVLQVVYPNDVAINNLYQNGYLDRLQDATTNKIYQDIVSMNSYGQVTDVDYANGAEEVIAYQANNGRVSSHSLSKGGVNKHLLTYQYDANANITYRRHEFNDKGYTDWNETLTYDSLNRLDYRNVSITDSSYLTTAFKTDQNYNYDDWGNLTYKYGVGYYNYNDTTRKHRLTGAGSYSMSYDPNGNITNDGNGRSFTYFSFDKVNRITKGSLYSEFKYGANRSRYYKYDKRTESGQTANYYTAYIGGYEKIHRTGGGKATLTEHKVTLGNVVITKRSNGVDEEHYLHKDHLGSTISVTDQTGAVVQQFTYDPWGKQTKIYQTSNFSNLVYNQPTNRGYTGHEQIDGLDIVHMNGRIYDANIGRFLQADPIIQSPGDFQNYNRYSYVRNNPLTLIDPSGYSWFSKTWKKIKKWVKPIIAAVAAYYTFGWAMGALGTTTTAAGFSLGGTLGFTATTTTYGIGAYIGAGAAAGFVGGAIMTGSLRGAAQGAAAGAISGLVGFSVGNATRLARGLSGGINGAIESRSLEGFARGFLSGQINVDLGLDVYKTNQFANFAINRVSDYARGYVIGGSRVAKRNLKAGLAQDGFGHAVGATTSYIEHGEFKAPKFRNGIYFYDAQRTIASLGAQAITFGNVVTGPSYLYSDSVDVNSWLYKHESSHLYQQRSLGPYYVPVHLVSQWGSALFGYDQYMEYSPFVVPGYDER